MDNMDVELHRRGQGQNGDTPHNGWGASQRSMDDADLELHRRGQDQNGDTPHNARHRADRVAFQRSREEILS